jgi:hypothetical protein
LCNKNNLNEHGIYDKYYPNRENAILGDIGDFLEKNTEFIKILKKDFDRIKKTLIHKMVIILKN